MNKILLAIIILAFSSISLAVPRGVYLAAPKKIEVIGTKVKLLFNLSCKNKNPDEWAGNLISLYDDEGDMAVGLGVVFSKSSCDPGPLREYSFEYNLKEIGFTANDIANGTTLIPLNLAK